MSPEDAPPNPNTGHDGTLGEGMRQNLNVEDNALDGEKLDNLCVRCGMCCTGYVFSEVGVEPEAVGRLEAGGLKIAKDEKGFGFSLPCAAYKGRCCSVYSYRPNICKNFKCKLLSRYIERKISLSEAIVIIEKLYMIIAELERSELYKELASENRRVFTVRDKLRNKVLESSDGGLDGAYGELALLLWVAHRACESAAENFLSTRKENDGAFGDATLQQKAYPELPA